MSSSKLSVLIVDDLPDWRITLQGLLQDLGYPNVDTASSIDEALSLLKTRTYNVALLDIRLDERDEGHTGGLTIAEAIADTDAPTEVIMFTGYPTFDTIHRSLKPDVSGKRLADAFMLKDEIFELITRLEHLEKAASKSSDTMFSHGYAVVIGMGSDLPVTAKDASALAALLRDPDRCAYPASQVQLLVNSDANRSLVLDALDRLASQTKDDPDSIAIVYFSGHGIETPGYFFLPNGYDLKDLPTTAISGQEFTEKLNAIEAKRLLVLLDCCHAGGIGEVKGQDLIKSPLPREIFDVLMTGSGRVLIASSRRDEKSYVAEPYSVFTDELLKALAGSGAFEKDGYARVLDAAMWLGRMVPARTGNKQNPIIKVSNLENNYAVAYYAGGDKAPKPVPWDTRQPISTSFDDVQIASLREQWSNYRENLMLIEARMSEFVEFAAIPLQLIKSKRFTETKIAELERKLGMAS